MNSMISIFLTSNGIDPFYVKAGIVALILILFLVLLVVLGLNCLFLWFGLPFASLV